MSILQTSLSGDVPVIHNNPLTKIFVTPEIWARMAFPRHDSERVHSYGVSCAVFWGNRGQEGARSDLMTAFCEIQTASKLNTNRLSLSSPKEP